MTMREAVRRWHGGQLIIACCVLAILAFGSYQLAELGASDDANAEVVVRYRVLDSLDKVTPREVRSRMVPRQIPIIGWPDSVEETRPEYQALKERATAAALQHAPKHSLAFYLLFGITIPLAAACFGVHLAWHWFGTRSPRH